MGRLNNQQQPENTIHHFSHSHLLQLSNHQPQQSVIQYVSCSGCKLPLSGWVYSCTPCNYFLHVPCSQMPQQITHPFDQYGHFLVLMPKPVYPEGAFGCDACGKQGSGFSYHCTECGIDLHINCASMPLLLTHHSHLHQLDLAFSPPYHNKSFSCDLCKNAGSNHWLYRCNSCDFDAHLDCATTKPRAHIQPPVHQNQMPQFQTVPRSVPQNYQINHGTQFPTTPPPQNYPPNNANPAVNGVAFRPNGQVGIRTNIMNQAIQGICGGVSQALVQEMLSGGGGSLNDSGGGDGGFIVLNDSGMDGSMGDYSI